MNINITIDRAERDTILAALRWYQHCGMGDSMSRPRWVHEIATSTCGAYLNDAGIDGLCERLNTGVAA